MLTLSRNNSLFYYSGVQFFKKSGFTPCKAENAASRHGVSRKEAQKDKAYRKSFQKEPTVKSSLNFRLQAI